MAQAGADVHLIARGAHLRALRGHGLRVRSVKSDFAVRILATDDPTDVGPCEYVLFCVKAFDSEAAAAKLRSLLSGGSAVVSLQNGVDNEEKLASVIGTEQVLGGVAFSFACIAEPDVIMQTGGPSSIIFGEPDGRLTGRAQRLLDMCERAGFAAELSSNIKIVMWVKLAFICALAGMTAAVRLPIGEIRPVDAGWKTFQRLVGEVAAVAEADGRPLPPAVVQLALAQGLVPGGFSSLPDDLVAGPRMELEALHGFVVRRAAAFGVPVPMSRAIYAIFQPWAVRNDRLRR